MISRQELTELTGVKSINKLSDYTTVVEFTNGGVRPASPLEVKMWLLLLTGHSGDA